MDWMEGIEPQWGWLALGFLLATLEMAVPGAFLIWLSGAAIITGLVAWTVPISMPLQIVLFAVLAIASVFTGKRYLRRNPIRGADPDMNNRGARILGDMVVVTHAIDGGTGRVSHGDSEWLARGPDAEPGTRMRISGIDGTVLLVEHLH